MSRLQYFQCVRLALKSKLNERNVFQAINILAVPIVQYEAGIIQWKRKNLSEWIGRRLGNSLPPRSCVDRFYI